MSSIISDLFYGSKQNILDNYLVNRHQVQQQSSVQNKQETVLYASFIEIVIRIPSLGQSGENMLLKVEIEMGSKSDQGFIDIKQGDKQSEAIVLVLNELEKQYLNKYTNIKVTISEGKYSKIHGFIPIESIKNIASSFSNEKTIIVQMKGKKGFPFSSIQCTIRTEFPNNNVLNSEILRSVEKDPQSYNKSKQHISDESSYFQVQVPQKLIVNKRRNDSNTIDKGRYIRKHDNIVIEQGENKKKGLQKIEAKAMTEFVKEIKSVQVRFSKIELVQSLKRQEEKMILKLEQRTFSIGQVIELTKITKQGVNIELFVENEAIGGIHLSPLLLTLQRISGQLPIYSPQQQCLGTITIETPNKQAQKNDLFTTYKQPTFNKTVQQLQIEIKKELVCLSIDKVVLINSLNSLNNSSFLDHSQADIYDFTKIELAKLEVLIRINGITHKFTDAVLNYIMDRDIIKIAQLRRRRQGFALRYFEDHEKEQLIVEIQIFSAYRLISYSRVTLALGEKISHKFISGDTSCPYFHSAIHLKMIRLQVEPDFFQQRKIGTIFHVLEDILNNRIVLNSTDDSQIKSIMAIHKKITYIQLKKLLTLLQKSMKMISKYQHSFIGNVYTKQNPERNEAMIKLSQRLLEEFLYIDSRNIKMVNKDDFEKVVDFYREQLQIALEKDYKAYITYPLCKDGNILYIFFVSGFYYVDNQAQSEDHTSEDQNKQTQSIHKSPQLPQIIKTIKEVSVTSEPTYFLSKIIITNAHLLNLGKAPNITLNIAKKISYSNSNPEFVIEREISLLTPIQICHKSIAQARTIVLAQFSPTRRQTLYQLQPSGKCFAKLVWGF